MSSVPHYNIQYGNAPVKHVIDPQHVGPNCPPYPVPPTELSQPTQMVYVQQSVIPPLGIQSVELTCPSCKAVVRTHIEEHSSNMAYIFCTILCIVGCCCVACVPFCMDNFKKYTHSCPRCSAFIGDYQP